MLNAILLILVWIILIYFSVRSIKESTYIDQLEEELRSTISNHDKYVDEKALEIKTLKNDYKNVDDHRNTLETENEKLWEENMQLIQIEKDKDILIKNLKKKNTLLSESRLSKLIKSKDKKINALKQTIIRRDRRIKNLLNKKK